MTTVNKYEDKYIVCTKEESTNFFEICNKISINGEIKEITKEDIKKIQSAK